MSLRNAIIVSFIGHCVVLTPMGNMGILFPQKKATDIHITYCQIKPPEPKPEKVIEIKKTEMPKAVPEAKTGAAPKKEAGPDARKDALVKHKAQKPRRAAPKPQPQKIEQENEPAKQKIIPQSIPGTNLPNTPQYVNRYNSIRGKIQYALKQNYSQDYNEGSVAVTFILNKSGQIIKLEINEDRSSDDPVLRQVACESIRESAPFKNFPKGLETDEILFNLTIVFKKN